MSINRRQFVSGAAAAGSIFMLCGTSAISAGTKWKDVVPWSHAWDAADAITYIDDGMGYNIPSNVRVDSVPDPIGGRPLLRDKLGLMLKNKPHIPGTIFQPSDSKFGGRSSWFSDTIIPHDPAVPSYAYSIQSMLNSVADQVGAPETVFGWQQPWWGAVLVRGAGPFGGHNQAYIDGNPGMVTISRSPKGTVIIRCWPEGLVMGPMIDSGAPYEEEAALVQWLANGTESWLEVNYRGADGVLVTKRVAGALGTSNMNQFHTGFTHTNHTSCIGLAKGIPTSAQTDAVRNWANPFIPNPSTAAT